MENYEYPDIEEFYVIGKLIGEGAFGKVKQLSKKDTGDKFAVKIIDKDNMDQNEFLSLQQEVEILTQIDHPNIVKMYELYEDDQNFYMVFELMTGGELFQRMVEQEHFSESKAAETVKAIVDALQYCHQMGIAHRDLKPENLLYETKEPGSIIKISDFGLARFIDNDLMMTICGTPAFVAPEIIKGKGYDVAVDFWSVGVILYIMLCGFPPFQHENIQELFEIIKRGQYSFPSPAWNGISDQAKDLIKGLLATDPAKRLNYDQIINHPWLTGKGINNNPIPELRGNLKDFNAKKYNKQYN